MYDENACECRSNEKRVEKLSENFSDRAVAYLKRDIASDGHSMVVFKKNDYLMINVKYFAQNNYYFIFIGSHSLEYDF